MPEVREWRIANDPETIKKAVDHLARVFDGSEDGVSAEVEWAKSDAHYRIYRFFLHPSDKYQSHDHAGLMGKGGDRPRNWWIEHDGMVFLKNSYQEEWLWSFEGKDLDSNAFVIGKFIPKGNSDDTKAVVYLREGSDRQLVIGVVLPKRDEAHELFPAIREMFPNDSEIGQPRTWAKWHEPNFNGSDPEILEKTITQLGIPYGVKNRWNKAALFTHAREDEMKSSAWVHYLNQFMKSDNTITRRVVQRIEKEKLIVKSQKDILDVMESVMGWKSEKDQWRLNLQRTLFKNEDHHDSQVTPFVADIQLNSRVKIQIQSEWRSLYRIDREGDVKIDSLILLGNPVEPLKVTASAVDGVNPPPTQKEIDTALSHFVHAYQSASRRAP
jgi:hypothetical protein